MKNRGTTLFKVGISLLLLVFLVYQTYAMLYKPITTATAVPFETYDGIEITGYFVREEKIINYTPTGNERYVVGEGEKVAKNGTVAEVYATAATAAAYVRADALKEQIATLSSINAVSDPASVDLDTLNNKISRAYLDLISSADSGNFMSIGADSGELLTLLNKKQILTGEVSDFNALLTSLNEELRTLTAGLSSPVSKVTADVSGYFISQVDGLEDILNIEEIDELDDTVFEKIAAAKPTGGFGKIVSDYNWYIVAQMENDDYLNLAKDTKLTFKTAIEGCEELSASVYKVNPSKDKNAAVVIFACSTMNGAIASTRSAPMTIVTDSYEGIRISNKSVRVVDGQTGVYIVQGSVVKFRPIEIVYATDTFTLCKQKDASDSNAIRLYDEVIEKGKNLYDGKYIG